MTIHRQSSLVQVFKKCSKLKTVCNLLNSDINVFVFGKCKLFRYKIKNFRVDCGNKIKCKDLKSSVNHVVARSR